MDEQQKRVDELYELVDGIETAIFVTQRHDGSLVSRPMATQKRNPIADLWFVTDIESDKIDELNQHPRVNLSYFSTKTKEWVSVSGSATMSNDRATIRELYQPDWKMWFGGECVIYPKQEKITQRRRERRGRREPLGPLCVPCAPCISA